MRAIGQIMLALATSMGVVTVAQPEQATQVAQITVPSVSVPRPAKKAEVDNGEVFVEVTADVKPAAPPAAVSKQVVTFVEEKECVGGKCFIRRRPVTTVTQSENAVVTTEVTTTRQFAIRDRERVVWFPRLRSAIRATVGAFAARPKLFGSRRCHCN